MRYLYSSKTHKMKLFSNKLDVITIIALVFMAISITKLDFDDLSWDNNVKSYVGLIIFAAFIVFRFIIRRHSNKNP